MSLKTFNGKAVAGIKTFLGKAIAGVKTVDWLALSVAVTYATRNPSDKSANITLSWGNLIATNSTAAWSSVRSTIAKSSGKRYREYTIGAGTDWFVGIGNSSATLSNYPWWDSNGYWYYYNDGSKWTANSYSAYWASYTTGNIIGVALDMTAGTITMYKNNVSQWTMYTGLTGNLYAMVGMYGNWASTSVTANFGATALTYTPPAGFNSGLYT